MTVLVFGASGLLGSNVAEKASGNGEQVVGTFYKNPPDIDVPLRACDLRDDPSVVNLVEDIDPSLIVNCAAMTDVDKCEQRPEDAAAINASAPEHIANLCADTGCQFVHISTDYIFDGETTGRYTESDKPNPLQTYGETKLEGEQRVRASYEEALILRLSFVYGIHQSTGNPTGFPAWVKSELAAGNSIPLFTDQYITPSRAGHVADVLLSLIEGRYSGTYNVTCEDCVTPYTIGEHIRNKYSHSGDITPSSITDVERLAPRPTRTCLDVSHLEDELEQQQPSIADDLEAIF